MISGGISYIFNPTRKNDTFLHDHERFAAKILSTLTVTDDDAVMQN